MNAQNLIIGHLLPIAATIAVFWLLYRLLFRNSNRLHFNRFFLLTKNPVRLPRCDSPTDMDSAPLCADKFP